MVLEKGMKYCHYLTAIKFLKYNWVENMDIKEINSYGQEMVECLKLKTSPVAVKLISKGGEIPAGIKKVDEVMTHCQFVDRVRRTGEEFYTLGEDQMCKIGSGTLGLNEIPPEVPSGESYYKNLDCLAPRELQDVPLKRYLSFHLTLLRRLCILLLKRHHLCRML